MSVIHVLADGSRVADITGHVVKAEHVQAVYELMTRISREQKKENQHERKNN